MADGQAYVTVQANASSSKSRSVGSAGVVNGSYVINWNFSGGITDSHGWSVPYFTFGGSSGEPDVVITPVPGDVDATNSAVSNALSGKNFLYIQSIIFWGCASAL